MSKNRFFVLVVGILLFVACATTSSQVSASPAQFDAFQGTYRGFAPTDESAVMLGETEIRIDATGLTWRMATGHEVIMDRMRLDQFRPMTDAEVAQVFKEGSPYRGRITGFCGRRNSRFQLLFFKDPKENPRDPMVSEFGLIVATGGAADIIAPQMLYNPAQVASGEYDRLLAMLSKDGHVPRIVNGGK